ncbi:hypothetical protein BKA83DRAFT_4292732 [Pisolithus microcarpus]|nr:hypothetical protein BKA83DRAFT_4292732 [Pisolithus microcarpus]
MEVVDTEYQQIIVHESMGPNLLTHSEINRDRRKLTFYFIAEKRIDFPELVQELFRLYKTHIWMASLQGPGGYEQ